uniref:Uncharacterized protein n=1 Tax=Amphimedon queenslandica TaxID=400682 RepID=A0A1X7TEW6_AMPQE
MTQEHLLPSVQQPYTLPPAHSPSSFH